jgi:hypothetical protein
MGVGEVMLRALMAQSMGVTGVINLGSSFSYVGGGSLVWLSSEEELASAESC